MTRPAETSASLLLRIRDSNDQEAWSIFVEIYGPLVFNLAVRMGLQKSDAADLVQEVMAEVHKCIERFKYNPKIGKFRSWLYKVAKRSLFRLQQKKLKQAQGIGGTDAIALLNQQAEREDNFQEAWDKEYQEYLVSWAAKLIRAEFNENVWRAFWLTAVKQLSFSEVAKELDMAIGNVYVAKCRVTKRLAEKIREFDDFQ